MKPFFVLLGLLLPSFLFSQSPFPSFLKGNWKIENKEVYEHWDQVNDETLKGFSYSIKNGQMKISEYLDISKQGDDIIYTATVLGQNAGKSILFTLTTANDKYIFENPNHDFPKKIVYTLLSENKLTVDVSDGDKKGFSLTFLKYPLPSVQDSTIENPKYDPVLAEKCGGDDYGMKGYILVILKSGKNESTDKDFINNCFKDHMSNIKKLVVEKKMIVAGPLGKNDKNYRGIFILNTTNFEEAEKWLQADSAIREGLLDADMYNWYGSAAMPEYLDAADKVWRKSI